MRVTIVKYNAGNTASVANALQRLGIDAAISNDPDTLRQSDKVIFPGVGEASSAMTYLRERGLDTVIRFLTQPVLGICLGMHLLCSESEENDTQCLGVLPSRVRRFSDEKLKVPHVGWNTIGNLGSPLFAGIPDQSFVYFVHGYFVESTEHVSALTDYGGQFTSAIEYENFHAVQFHPEKSGEIGERILRNFLNL